MFARVLRAKLALFTMVGLLLGSLAVPRLHAQEAARRIGVFFEVEEDIAADPARTRFLYESLLVALHRENPNTEFLTLAATPEEGEAAAVDGASPTVTDAQRTVRSRSGGADAWILVTVERAGGGSRYGVSVRSVFLYSGETVLELFYEAAATESERSLALRLWNRGARAVAEAYSTVSTESTVIIRGAPGSEIVGLTGTRIRMQSDELRVVLEQPGVYELEAESDLHYPQRLDFFLGGREAEIILNQDERSQFLVSAYGQEFSYFGVDLSYMIAPPHVFIRGGFYTYAFGIVPFVDPEANENQAGEAQLRVSRPLTNLRLLFGTYWNRPHGNLRLYSAAGPLVRIITSSAFTGLEPIAPWGIELVNGVEFFPERKLRLFFEHTPTVAIAAEPDFLAAQFSDDSGIEPIIFDGDSGYLDLLSVRLGVRYQW
ncbi:MAG: hypothetical protein GVY23_00555 [Spirochaetes bacterium]|jgi:hypothetical protein|nr:hypothetical protein [Spirochaetota bacterium]